MTGVATCSAAMEKVSSQISHLRGKRQVNVLIVGESGTGKEIVARSLHHQEEGTNRPFVAINMAALPHSLFESEFFGVEKGAFTDANFSRAGKVELAHGGDLFLDEIGDLELDSQAKLLRFVQDRHYQRLGSPVVKVSDVRTISATNLSLALLVSQSKFRVDLLYRLADVTIQLPPLRERAEDIPALAEHFLERYRLAFQLKPRKLSAGAMEILIEHRWPGNIRQLESTVKRALIFSEEPEISALEIAEQLDLDRSESLSSMEKPTASVRMVVQNKERELIEAALRKHGGNRSSVWKELQLARSTFYRRLKALDIDPRHYELSPHSVR